MDNERLQVLIEIKEGRPDDIAAVREVNRRAFAQEQEGNIVDASRDEPGNLVFVSSDGERTSGRAHHVQPGHCCWKC